MAARFDKGLRRSDAYRRLVCPRCSAPAIARRALVGVAPCRSCGLVYRIGALEEPAGAADPVERQRLEPGSD